MTWLIVATGMACALMGGIFFAFSSFVMPALGRIPPKEGIHAMQRINIDVFHWSFIVAFFGTPIACIAVAALAASHWPQPGALYSAAGCAVYLVGTFGVTAARNVPRNNALAAIDTDSVDPGKEWARFAIGWTRWNHVRTAAAIVAAVSFFASLPMT